MIFSFAIFFKLETKAIAESNKLTEGEIIWSSASTRLYVKLSVFSPLFIEMLSEQEYHRKYQVS